MKSSFPAELLVDPAEESAAQTKRQPLRYLEEPVPQGLPALPGHLSLDPVHEQLQPLRDEQHDRDLALAHRPGQNGRLTAGRIRNARAVVQSHEQPAHLLVHVAQRKDGQEPARGVAEDVLGYPLDICRQVPMGEHDALRVARRAGSKHDLGEVIPLNVHVLRFGQTGDSAFQLLERYLRDSEVRLLFRREPRREGQFRFRPGHDPCDVVGRAAKVEGDHDDSRPQTAEEDEHPVGRVRAPEDDLVPFRQSPALEEGCNLAGLVP